MIFEVYLEVHLFLWEVCDLFELDQLCAKTDLILGSFLL